ncbi:hypothetical protein GJ496_002325 [Pomphorhynchus laevis]|nr:hypothetical protein GJ496_002325 [Pomphorhynchus laevis]
MVIDLVNCFANVSKKLFTCYILSDIVDIMLVYFRYTKAANELQLELQPEDSIGDYRSVIADNFNIASIATNLLFKGKVLKDNMKWQDYNVVDGSLVRVCLDKNKSTSIIIDNETMKYEEALKALVNKHAGRYDADKFCAFFLGQTRALLSEMNLEDLDRLASKL